MNVNELADALGQNDAGLLFLAGLDFDDSGRGGLVTIHARKGMLRQSERDFISQSVRLHAPGFDMLFEEYETDGLRAARSLEAFAKSFAHDQILADPTGSFARLQALLTCVGDLRDEFSDTIGTIMWQPTAARLVFVLEDPHGQAFEATRSKVEQRIAETNAAGLFGVIKSVSFSALQPTGNYTFVDRASAKRSETARPARLGRSLRLKLTALVAMISFGTVAAAGAPRVTGAQEPADPYLPGVSALVDLTSLGESAFGTHNPFKAEGGLRLFFGDSLVLPEDVPGMDGLSDFLDEDLLWNDLLGNDGLDGNGEPFQEFAYGG